jgi:protein SCO1/2
MDRKLVWVGVGALILIILATWLTAMFARPPEFRGTVYEPKAAPAIDLPGAAGGAFHLGDLKGKVVLLFFGYTHCPDVCPTSMANLKQVVSQLGADGKRVQVVFVTVDPDRDTPQGTQEYASLFDPSFVGLSGSAAELEPVWSSYGIYRELAPQDAAGNYEIAHTARITVIDPAGNLHLSFNADASWQDILHDIQLLLDEG